MFTFILSVCGKFAYFGVNSTLEPIWASLPMPQAMKLSARQKEIRNGRRTLRWLFLVREMPDIRVDAGSQVAEKFFQPVHPRHREHRIMCRP
jgi:hypothetical protein